MKADMNIEYEAVFAPVNKEEIRETLARAGALCEREEYLQRRINFTLPKESPYSETGWIRVREEGGVVTMSLKAVTNNDVMEGQKEICLNVDDYEEARAYMNALGCKEKAYQETKRELWKLDGVEICIDEWPWLEPFIEIEGDSELAVKNVAEKLGFSWADAIFGAVDLQYEKKYGVSKRVINNETPRFVFGEPCPF